jgi:transposase
MARPLWRRGVSVAGVRLRVVKSGRRFRVELTEGQARLAQQTADVCRAVWNIGLEQRREYRRRGAWMNYNEQAQELVEAKEEQTWLKAAPSHCLQQTLKDLDEACRRRWHVEGALAVSEAWAPSFRFPEGSQMELRKLNRRKTQVKLHKLGWVKFRASRSLDGETIRSATLSNEGERWFVSFLVEDGKTPPAGHANADSAVGVDRGVVVAVATSAGELPNGAAAKSGLNKAILSKGWYRFEQALNSVSRYTGTVVVKVPAAFTSQRCSVCGHVDPKSRESQAVFRCTHCARPAEHADVNAAKNILAAGLAVTVCEDHPRRSRNQQETARNYCSNPKTLRAQHERVGIPRIYPWGGRQGVSDRPAVHRCAAGAHLRGYQRSDEGDHRQIARVIGASEN